MADLLKLNSSAKKLASKESENSLNQMSNDIDSPEDNKDDENKNEIQTDLRAINLEIEGSEISKKAKASKLLIRATEIEKKSMEDNETWTKTSIAKIEGIIIKPAQNAPATKLASTVEQEEMFLALQRYLHNKEKPFTKISDNEILWHLKHDIDLKVTNDSIEIKKLPEDIAAFEETIRASFAAAKASGWNSLDIECDKSHEAVLLDVAELFGLNVVLKAQPVKNIAEDESTVQQQVEPKPTPYSI
jgi:hypothetical protein